MTVTFIKADFITEVAWELTDFYFFLKTKIFFFPSNSKAGDWLSHLFAKDLLQISLLWAVIAVFSLPNLIEEEKKI